MNAADMTIEEHPEFWAKIARENGWHKEPFYVQVWVGSGGAITDSVSHQGMTQDIVVEE